MREGIIVDMRGGGEIGVTSGGRRGDCSVRGLAPWEIFKQHVMIQFYITPLIYPGTIDTNRVY